MEVTDKQRTQLDKARKRIEKSYRKDTEDLEWYLVGGAVRDIIRGEEPKDYDFVVVGETPKSMDERGYERIENETFPVYQGKYNDEIALARNETTTGSSYKDFQVDIDDVTLKEDLERRDFTMNAIAWNPDRGIVDPHDGILNIQGETIQHVSDAFSEDPLRVVRGARFAARFDFEIASTTVDIMKKTADKVESMHAQRLKEELIKNFEEAKNPRKFFDILAEVGALSYSYPWVAAMFNVGTHEEHHQEGHLYEHTMRVVEEFNSIMPNDVGGLLMALYHDVGKVNGDSKRHAKRGREMASEIADHYNFSNEHLAMIKDGCYQHQRLKRIDEMNDGTIYDTFHNYGTPLRTGFLIYADQRGREPQQSYDLSEYIKQVHRVQAAIGSYGGKDLIDEGYKPDQIGGEKFGELLRDKRIQRMDTTFRELKGVVQGIGL